MRRSRRLVAMAGGAVCLAAAPLFADEFPPIRERVDEPAALRALAPESPLPSGRPVREVEWAALLVEALTLASALPQDHGADDLFTLLCPDAAESGIAAGARSVPARPSFRVAVDAPQAPGSGRPLHITVDVPATAIYALWVEGAGRQHWSIDRRPLGQLDPSPLGADAAPELLPLSRGTHQLEARLAPDARVDRVELSAHRALCVAPADGWNAERRLTFGAKARSMVRALGLDARLPIDGEAIVVEGEAYHAATDGVVASAARDGTMASGDRWAVAEGSDVELEYRVQLDKPGVYGLLARLHGDGRQLWSIDGRYRVMVRGGARADGFAWATVATLPLASGEHVIRARVPRGSGIDVLRLARRRASDADYLEVLETAGFDEGAVAATVTIEDARRNLAHPAFRALSADYLSRLSGDSGDGIALIQRDLGRLYTRPLSPILPADL